MIQKGDPIPEDEDILAVEGIFYDELEAVLPRLISHYNHIFYFRPCDLHLETTGARSCGGVLIASKCPLKVLNATDTTCELAILTEEKRSFSIEYFGEKEPSLQRAGRHSGNDPYEKNRDERRSDRARDSHSRNTSRNDRDSEGGWDYDRSPPNFHGTYGLNANHNLNNNTTTFDGGVTLQTDHGLDITLEGSATVDNKGKVNGDVRLTVRGPI